MRGNPARRYVDAGILGDIAGKVGANCRGQPVGGRSILPGPGSCTRGPELVSDTAAFASAHSASPPDERIGLMCHVRHASRVLLAMALGVLAVLVGLATPAAATVTWANEQAMIDETSRSSYIFDVGAGNTISNEQFAAPDVAAFYEGHGFNRNFMYWAPIISIPLPAEYWKACL